MRLQPQTVTLGARSWPVRPLTLAQLQAIEPLLFAAEPSASSSMVGTVATAIAVLRVALARDHAADAGALDEVEAGAPELSVALAQVLRLGGFIAEDPAPGEAGAGRAAPDGSTGPRSTAD